MIKSSKHLHGYFFRAAPRTIFSNIHTQPLRPLPKTVPMASYKAIDTIRVYTEGVSPQVNDLRTAFIMQHSEEEAQPLTFKRGECYKKDSFGGITIHQLKQPMSITNDTIVAKQFAKKMRIHCLILLR